MDAWLAAAAWLNHAVRCNSLSMKYWLGRKAREFQKYQANTLVIARIVSSVSGLRSCCFAVRRLWVQSQVGISYRNVKWLWSIRWLVYLFMDARREEKAWRSETEPTMKKQCFCHWSGHIIMPSRKGVSYGKRALLFGRGRTAVLGLGTLVI